MSARHSSPPQVSSVTAAVTNVSQNTTLVPAGLATEQTRVLAVHVGLAQNAGVGAFEIAFREGAGGFQLAQIDLQAPSERWHYFEFPDPGIFLSGGTALVLSHIANIAGPTSVRCFVYHYTDNIA